MDKITRWYLEMTSPGQLKAVSDAGQLEIKEVEIKQYQLNRFFYQYVGAAWQWFDKLSWSDQQWQDWAERDELRMWIAYDSGTPAGYYELEQSQAGDTEVAYFGLAPKFIGKAYGGYLLSHAVRSAWAWSGTKRVWLHTCSLDHPGALNNYKARGFEIYREESIYVVPDT